MDREKMNLTSANLSEALWRIYRRPDPPGPWELGGNLPWDDPAFSQRMLAEHLDQSHGAASRQDRERTEIIDWLWQKLELQAGDHVLDFTCGPGLYAVELAQRGCHVTGIDFSPAAIAHARSLAKQVGAQDRCLFLEKDVREVELQPQAFDAAIFLYGQMAVFPRHEALDLLRKISASLKPGARLAVELLDQRRVDKESSSWWFTDDKGLWGTAPFLHLGERFWLSEERMSVERYFIIDLQTHEMMAINLCDQTYALPEMIRILRRSGFERVNAYREWDNLDLYDRQEWVVYLAQK